MSLSDVYRDRYYSPGYVYIAGSLAGCVLKIGTTVNIRKYRSKLRSTRYGDLADWELLYYVWVDEGGKIEHEARSKLARYKTLRSYKKDGRWQRGREIVDCRFGIALKALSQLLTDEQRSEAWKLRFTEEYEFGWEESPSILFEGLAPTRIPQPCLLLQDIKLMNLSVRSENCLRNEGIDLIGSLVTKSESEMIRLPNFGRKSLNEIKGALSTWGLSLGVEVLGWPPANLNDLSVLAAPFLRQIGELDISRYTSTRLIQNNIFYVGDVVQLSEADLLRMPGLGQKAIEEIKKAVSLLGLSLETKIVF